MQKGIQREKYLIGVFLVQKMSVKSIVGRVVKGSKLSEEGGLEFVKRYFRHNQDEDTMIS